MNNKPPKKLTSTLCQPHATQEIDAPLHTACHSEDTSSSIAAMGQMIGEKVSVFRAGAADQAGTPPESRRTEGRTYWQPSTASSTPLRVGTSVRHGSTSGFPEKGPRPCKDLSRAAWDPSMCVPMEGGGSQLTTHGAPTGYGRTHMNRTATGRGVRALRGEPSWPRRKGTIERTLREGLCGDSCKRAIHPDKNDTFRHRSGACLT